MKSFVLMLSFLLWVLFSVLFSPALFAQEECEDGFVSFRKTFHPFVRNRCANCHGDGGTLIQFAAKDPTEAYSEAIWLTNFDDMERSRFFIKAKAQHWFSKPKYKDGDGAKLVEVTQALYRWWNQGQFLCTKKFEMDSEGLVLKNLPTRKENKYKSYTWNLSSAGLNGVDVSADVQKFSDPEGNLSGSYRLQNLQIKTDSKINIKGIWFSVSGQMAAYENSFEDIDLELEPKNNKQKISDSNLILIQRKKVDEIRVHFEKWKLRE
jgi:hypothetical protein